MARKKGNLPGITSVVHYGNIATGEIITDTARTGEWLRSRDLVQRWVREKKVESALQGVVHTMAWAYLHARTMGLAGTEGEPSYENMLAWLDLWDTDMHDEDDEDDAPLGLTD